MKAGKNIVKALTENSRYVTGDNSQTALTAKARWLLCVWRVSVMSYASWLQDFCKRKVLKCVSVVVRSLRSMGD